MFGIRSELQIHSQNAIKPFAIVDEYTQLCSYQTFVTTKSREFFFICVGAETKENINNFKARICRSRVVSYVLHENKIFVYIVSILSFPSLTDDDATNENKRN